MAMIVCCLGYKLGDVDISQQMRRLARIARKEHRIADENFSEETVQIPGFKNLKSTRPIWRGDINVKSEVFEVNTIEVDAYLSSEACQKVKKFAGSSMPHEIVVEKVPRSEVWPKRWKYSGPTDACIGLVFFPRGLRPNEASDKMVNEAIESDSAFKVTVGIVDLLIFPSTMLAEQNRLYEGKHYLWGVFKQWKATSGQGVPVAVEDVQQKEHQVLVQQDEVQHESAGQETHVMMLVGNQQDGSACAVEEVQQQVRHLSDLQDEMQNESARQKTSAVKLVGNQSLVEEHNPEAEEEAMDISIAEDVTLPGSSLSHAEPIAPSSVAEPSTEEGGHGQSSCVSEPPAMKLFGVSIPRKLRAQQPMIQDITSEGSMVFSSVPEEMVTADSNIGNIAAVGTELNTTTDHQVLSEHHDLVFDANGLATMTLFGVSIAWTPRAQQLSQEIPSEGPMVFSVPGG